MSLTSKITLWLRTKFSRDIVFHHTRSLNQILSFDMHISSFFDVISGLTWASPCTTYRVKVVPASLGYIVRQGSGVLLTENDIFLGYTRQPLKSLCLNMLVFKGISSNTWFKIATNVIKLKYKVIMNTAKEKGTKSNPLLQARRIWTNVKWIILAWSKSLSLYSIYIQYF